MGSLYDAGWSISDSARMGGKHPLDKEIKGLPVGVKLVAVRRPRFGDFYIFSDGALYSYDLLFDSGVRPIVEPDNGYHFSVNPTGVISVHQDKTKKKFLVVDYELTKELPEDCVVTITSALNATFDRYVGTVKSVVPFRIEEREA